MTMTDNKDQHEQAPDQSSTFAADTNEGKQEQAPNPFVVLEKLNAENAELKDRTLRTLAEMENLRRRTEREVADAKLYGVTKFAGDMVGFADNLRRAVESVPADARDIDAVKALVEGLELTERDFLARLNRYGVRKLEPQGQKFDPNMHEALFEIPDPGVPANTVLQVVEAGFAIGERCLRPAKVGVSRGGPKIVSGEDAPATGA
jgi:molecular chaperone GrpE